MRVFQLLITLAFGDAVSNDALALEKAISSMGYKTKIYTLNADPRLPADSWVSLKKMPSVKSSDVIIYHMAIGTELNYTFGNYNCRKIMVYHNVTPPEFFLGYSKESEKLCIEGLEGVKHLSDKVSYCLADSSFNKEQLILMGYKCRIDVLPILIPFSDYDKQPNYEIVNKYSDEYTNIIFTGRIAPNKKQEDIISSFYYYKKYINPKSRLFLVGSYKGMEKYYTKLRMFVDELELQDVYFTGHIKFADILAYYKLADVFLCMSEHEGFCVPLVEAMYFDIPIIAYHSTAIGDTLGNSGILLEEKDSKIAAEMINLIVTNNNLRTKVLENQRIRLKDFSHDLITQKFKDYLSTFIEENG